MPMFLSLKHRRHPTSAAALPNVVQSSGWEVPQLLANLRSSPQGISRIEAFERRGRVGPNEISRQRPIPWYGQLLLAFHTPFNYLLIVLAIISALTDDWAATVIISIMVAISGLLRFWQEYRSGQAAEALRALVRTTVTVVRPIKSDQHSPAQDVTRGGFAGRRSEIPMVDLVPGDVVSLSAGDLIPADLRLITAKDLFINQATLTGESIPVEKHVTAPHQAQQCLDGQLSPLDLANVCFMGTTVVSGTATAVVVCSGDEAYLGALAKHVIGKPTDTAFDKGVRGVSWLLIRFMLVMVPVVFLLNGLTKGDWSEAFLFGLAVAVGLTPEMLPMIVTANMARGAVAMSKRKVIVKKLTAIQNLGAMDVLCTDKTGTLTQDKVILLQHLDPEGNESEDVLEYAYLNSYFQTGLNNLLDRAVLEHENLVQTRELTERYIKCDEIPFDFQRRRMSVVVHEVFRGRDLLICKGAVEEILSLCSQVRIGGQTLPLSDQARQEVLATRTALNEDGLRVIGVAIKQVDSHGQRHYGVADEDQLVLVGFVAFLDPPKESAAPALAALAEHGVDVKILTGDNELVARKVCRDVGLRDAHILLGQQLDRMQDEELEAVVRNITVFAKLSPDHKARVIAALKRCGHTVGFLGDGINDAPALKEADVGVSVDSAADIAKESADIILLEKSLMVVEDGVLLGRQTYGNTIKYIKMTASSNFGNVYSVLVASVWLPFLPMLAIHLLIQNLLYDISQIGIPFDSMDDEFVAKPRKWDVSDLTRFMLLVGPTSSIFDMTTFALMFYLFQANTVENQALFHSGWFIEGLLSQTLIIHMIRTSKIPFIQSTASLPLVALTLVVMGLGVAIPFTPLGAAVGLVPLPISYFPWLVVTLISYCVTIHWVKRWYIRRFGGWL